jgi:hypothetical protein
MSPVVSAAVPTIPNCRLIGFSQFLNKRGPCEFVLSKLAQCPNRRAYCGSRRSGVLSL